IVLEGYVINQTSGDKVAYASVYDTTSFASAISDEYGHYSLRLSTKNDIWLSARKVGFQDTIFEWTGEQPNVMNISIRPTVIPQPDARELPENTPVSLDTTHRKLKFFKPSMEQKVNLMNIRNKLQRKVQFSVVPGVGTNGKLSGSTTVDYSVNLLAGFNGGVRVFEMAGIGNIDWDSVSYLQMAGVFNAVGGPQRGVQLAGLTNLNDATFKGVQMAGFTNVVRKHLTGVQLAGFSNYAHSANGAQLAGFTNIQLDSSDVLQMSGFLNYGKRNNRGAQLAGFANVQGRTYSGVQLAGFTNYVGDSSKFIQLSGFSNVAGRNAKGIQLAGFLNVARKNSHVTQASGFINVAGKLKGAQLGVFNFNDSIDGVAIGFLTFSRKGLHQLEIAGDEVFPANLSLRTGTHHFYNVIGAGYHFGSSASQVWRATYGIGTSVRLGERHRLFFDLQSSMMATNTQIFENQGLHRFLMTYQFAIFPKVAVSLGPSFNVLVSNDHSDLPSELQNLAPYNLNHSATSNSVKAWIGGQLAIRLF
ncbi:MAG: hypothetical protein A3D92_08020, partial [Bacteroidetes bacterium RIFCSPHIGHO2_02_FULL_44_7]